MSNPSRVIRWTDNGPVKHYEVEVPDEGLLVFEGPPGSGKSTMLESLDDALDDTHKSRMPIRDGAPRAEVDIFGQATLRRSRQTRRIGHLEIATLSGKFSISDLVDPKFDKLDSREAVRIKAILQLTSAKADASAFYHLAGGQEEFDELVGPDQLGTIDIVEMSASIKSAFELKARSLEAEVTRLQAKAEAARVSAGEVDTSAPHDEKKLSQAYKVALQEQSRLEAEQKAYEDASKKQRENKEALDKLAREYTGLGRHEAYLLADKAKAIYLTAQEEVVRLREELRLAEVKMASTKAASELADQTLATAQAHTNAFEALQAAVDSELPEPVLDLDLQTAENEVKIALGAVEKGALIRKALSDLQNASNLKSEANTAELKAGELREAGRSVDAVLADAIQSLGLPITVADGRLKITNSDRSPDGLELFEELSKGEKTKAVVRIAIKAVGPGGMFVIPQEFYEGLTESNILEIAQELENTGVLAITAKAVDGEGITAKVVEGFPLA